MYLASVNNRELDVFGNYHPDEPLLRMWKQTLSNGVTQSAVGRHWLRLGAVFLSHSQWPWVVAKTSNHPGGSFGFPVFNISPRLLINQNTPLIYRGRGYSWEKKTVWVELLPCQWNTKGMWLIRLYVVGIARPGCKDLNRWNWGM